MYPPYGGLVKPYDIRQNLIRQGNTKYGILLKNINFFMTETFLECLVLQPISNIV